MDEQAAGTFRQKANGYIPGLDGLRAISVLCVIAGHAGIPKVPADLGVTIFFFISGFLITGLLLSENDRKGGISVGAFYARRYLRLMPELALYIVVALAALAITGHGPRAIDVLGAVFYFTNYLIAFNPNEAETVFRFGHFWSLAVEEHFYLTWPWIVSFARGRSRTLIAIVAGLLVLSPVLRAIDIGSPNGIAYVRVASECRFDSIAFGAALAILMRRHSDLIARLATVSHLLFAIGLAVMLAFTYGSVIRLSGPAHNVLVFTGQGIGLFLIFTYLYATQASNWLIGFLEMPALRWVGRLSYGIYIWQSAIVFFVAGRLGASGPETLTTRQSLIAAAVSIAISVLAGWISWYLALQPVTKLRRRFGAHIVSSPPA